MRTYAIGDIHGFIDELHRAHALIAADRAETGDTDAPIVHIGDTCDRGPDSRGVVGHLQAGIAAGENWVVLKGNHDRMFTYFMQTPIRHDPRLRAELSWLDPRLGGDTTLASYGVDVTRDQSALHAQAQDHVPVAHLEFLSDLRPSFQRGDVFFCHAGIRPGVPLGAQVEDDLCWIRDGFLDSPVDHGPLIVHGHTAIDRAAHYGNRLNIDSSAGYGKPISAVVIEGREAWLLTDTGREPLLP